MKPATSPLLVPFREVRHDQPDDCLHYESVAVRGQEMDWTIPAHRHEGLHQFQFLDRGRLAGSIDGRAFEADGPVLLLLAPGAVHGFTYSRDAVGHQVTLPAAALAQLLGHAEQVRSDLGASFIVDGDTAREAAGEARALFEAVAREFRGNQPGRVQALLSYATLIAVLFLRRRSQSPAGQRQQGVRDTLVQRYRALVEQHYGRHQPLGFYADALGVTPDHLSRCCRQVTGQSALELLHERLMLEARRLLTYTPMPVAQIARQLGYDDAAYFSKFFHRTVGLSPSEYRRQIAVGVRAGA
jgi:AraC family transcriptional regulator, transcriptional activator of pobA